MVTPIDSAAGLPEGIARLLKRCDSIVQANNAQENAQARARGGPEIKPLRYADLYRLLSEVELRLGDAPRALDHAHYALDLSPFSAPMYLELADVLVHSGRADEGAVALMEGEMITYDPGLKEQHGATLPGRSGSAGLRCCREEWSSDAQSLLRNRSPASLQGSAGVEQIYTQAGRADLAATTRGSRGPKARVRTVAGYSAPRSSSVHRRAVVSRSSRPSCDSRCRRRSACSSRGRSKSESGRCRAR